MTAAVLRALVQAAVDATAARGGWVVGRDDGGLRVLAAAGADATPLIGTVVGSNEGVTGFVIASGQPLAIGAQSGDQRLTQGLGARLEPPAQNVLCVPCATTEDVTGALELIDKRGDTRFSFDDIELATLLGGIAGVALAEQGEGTVDVPTPAQLQRELERLAEINPPRYATVATVVSSILGSG